MSQGEHDIREAWHTVYAMLPSNYKWDATWKSYNRFFFKPIIFNFNLRWPTLVSVAQRSAHCRHSALWRHSLLTWHSLLTKWAWKGSDIDMCIAIYFLFDHNTKCCTIYLCPHTVIANVYSYYVTGYYVTSSCQSESRTHTKKWSKMAKESSEGEFLKKKVLITTGIGLKIYARQTLSRKRWFI